MDSACESITAIASDKAMVGGRHVSKYCWRRNKAPRNKQRVDNKARGRGGTRVHMVGAFKSIGGVVTKQWFDNKAPRLLSNGSARVKVLVARQ